MSMTVNVKGVLVLAQDPDLIREADAPGVCRLSPVRMRIKVDLPAPLACRSVAFARGRSC